MAKAKECHKNLDKTVLVMLYPTPDAFGLSFEERNDFYVMDDLHGDTIIGINGPFEDDKLELLLSQIMVVFKDWEKVPFQKPELEATL